MTIDHHGSAGSPGAELASTADPVADPGLPAHTWRPTDVDEAAARRAERQVAALFVFAMVCSVLFVVAYFTLDIERETDLFAGLGASNLALGLTLGGALLGIGIGVIQWARKLMADHEMVEMRHPAASSEDDREATIKALNDGLEESGIARRPLIRNTLLGSLAFLGLPAVVVLRDLGPTPGNVLYSTVWEQGMRLARDVVGTPIRVSDMEIGDLINGQPMAIFEANDEGEPLFEGEALLVEKSKSSIILVRMEPDSIIPAPGRENWSVEGILCYSKICTHVGCPISLYEQQTHHLLCPCHQSTFDLADSAKVIFGPAARPLPQLPLAVDEEGYLVAQSDFTEPVGPSFWERG